jgi:hypothetical protein
MKFISVINHLKLFYELQHKGSSQGISKFRFFSNFEVSSSEIIFIFMFLCGKKGRIETALDHKRIKALISLSHLFHQNA